MEYSITILWRIFVMMLLMVCGFIFGKIGFLDEKTTGNLSSILTKFILPASIIASFIRPFQKQEAISFISAFGVDMAFFIISAIIASFFFKRKHQNGFQDKRMCTIFVNNGFFALPILSALFGDYGIFIGSAHICAMNIFLWTYGVYLFKGKEGINVKSALINPGIIATLIGSLLFVSSAILPSDITAAMENNAFTSSFFESIVEALTMVKNLNTPLAMLVAGAWLQKAGIIKSISDATVWISSLVRVIVIPAILLLIIYVLPMDKDIKTIIMLGSSAPTAITAATFSQINKADYVFCTKVITVSTLLSALTMPLFVILLSWA